MSAPLDRSATWPYDASGEPGRYSYARAEQPNAVAVEAELGSLEAGRSLLFPAGMAAVTGVVLTMLPPGGTIALAEGSYYGHKQLFDHIRPWGVEVVEYDQTGAPPAGADLILLEAPSNPMLTMPDFEAAGAPPAPGGSGPSGAGRLRRHARLAAPPAAARARLRRLAPQRHQGARRARRPHCRRRHREGRRPLRSPPPHPPADRAHCLSGHRLAARARPEDARGPVRAHGDDGPGAGRAARAPPRGDDDALPRVRLPDLV